MKQLLGVLLGGLAGGLLAFFGVFVSVFADGGTGERLLTVGVILLLYFALGGALGLLLPRPGWTWGLLAGAPGAVLLILYSLREPRLFHLVYLVLILCCACLGAWYGSALRRTRER